jgi:hypothetical protein
VADAVVTFFKGEPTPKYRVAARVCGSLGRLIMQTRPDWCWIWTRAAFGIGTACRLARPCGQHRERVQWNIGKSGHHRMEQ